MKKFSLSVFAIACSLALSGCSGSSDSSGNVTQGNSQQITTAEAEAKAKAEAEAKAKAEAEAKAKTEAEAKAKTEAEGKAKTEAEGKAKTEAEEKARAEAEAKAKAEAEAKAKAESEAKAKAEAEAKAKAEAEAKAKAEAEAKAKAEAEAKAKAEAEAKAKAEAEAKAKAEAEAKAKAEAEAKAKAEAEAKARAEAEAKLQAQANEVKKILTGAFLTAGKQELDASVQKLQTAIGQDDKSDQSKTEALARMLAKEKTKAEALNATIQKSENLLASLTNMSDLTQQAAVIEEAKRQAVNAQAMAAMEKTFTADKEQSYRWYYNGKMMNFGGYTSDAINGAELTLDSAGNIISADVPKADDTTPNQITINGKTIPLTVEENTSLIKAFDDNKGYYNNVKAKYDSSLSFSYGVYLDNGNSVLFVKGKPSSGAPTASLSNPHEYLYTGGAVYGKDGKYESAASSVNVSFKNRTVDVTITPTSSGAFSFSGSFDSDNSYSGNNNGVVHNGGIFSGVADDGSSYKHAAGIFYRTEGEHAGYNGAYGATKP